MEYNLHVSYFNTMCINIYIANDYNWDRTNVCAKGINLSVQTNKSMQSEKIRYRKYI